MLDPEKLREAFKRKRHGSAADYDPDFDLFDAAADEIDRLRAVLTEIANWNEADACAKWAIERAQHALENKD